MKLYSLFITNIYDYFFDKSERVLINILIKLDIIWGQEEFGDFNNGVLGKEKKKHKMCETLLTKQLSYSIGTTQCERILTLINSATPTR